MMSQIKSRRRAYARSGLPLQGVSPRRKHWPACITVFITILTRC